jgi:DNA-binding GntR family transcriptional regulator
VADDIVTYLDVNQKLKFTIYSYCDSPKLYSLIEILWLQAGPALRYHAKVLRGITDINFHREAIAGLEKRKRAAAGAAIARDIRAGMDALLAVAQFADDETPDEAISDGQEE